MRGAGFVSAGTETMLMTKKRRPAIRTLRGWAIGVLQDAGAIRECEEHGWQQDRADPHARERAFDIVRQDPPPGSRRRRPPSRLRKCSTRPAIPAPSVRLKLVRPTYRAVLAEIQARPAGSAQSSLSSVISVRAKTITPLCRHPA
jgi:hypothetical protein